ncbi:hypothetical protein [Rhizobium sp. LC145]|uniref:hypothetical protein n=1 Tax=Rhizobium sp. LC145 TaxID=1120688 RepID=UPI00062A4BF4|nr:hypothetical protein [Rhizobium sp. LC145]KKX28262.1 hypothetical protein YH62_19460 [Rhizobium sp. LC145]TKT58315.1 hypothetical protein FDR95_11940 [Rhizobiaceae bacterium LC148]
MNRRIIASTAFFAIALSACTSTGPIVAASNPIEARWVGRSAGEFFAKYAPPLSDVESGSNTIYSWRGGYKRVKLANGRNASVSCSAQITVSQDYTIRDIKIIADRPGTNGPSYCTELLTGE